MVVTRLVSLPSAGSNKICNHVRIHCIDMFLLSNLWVQCIARAFQTDTHWYHAHSGAHRTDGLYSALIVNDTIPGLHDKDLPQNHTLLLMDWQVHPSIDLFYQIRSSLSYWYGVNQNFMGTVGMNGMQIAPVHVPFWSGTINDKGRHFDIRSSYTKQSWSEYIYHSTWLPI